jgi:hypothetical protein
MATSPIDTQAAAIAARFASGALTAPVGYATIRSSTANPPGAIGPTPAVVVTINDGTYDHRHGGQGRTAQYDWFVRFYLDQTSDIERAEVALRKWMDVFQFQMRGAVQLGGTVDECHIDSFRVGVLSYGGLDYAGIEMVVHTATSEPWAAVA